MGEMTWGVPIVVDLFFTGIGGGSFCLGTIASKRRGEGWNVFSRMASFLTPLAILLGLSMLMIDLGYRARFWITLTKFNLNSPMSIGVWLLSVFLLISIFFAIYWVPAHVRKRIPWFGTLSIWNRLGYRDRLGVVGIPLALGVSAYTGVLLSVSTVPLWRSVILPLLSLLSALSTGFAAGAILGIVCLFKRDLEAIEEPLRFLRQSYRIILPIYLLTALSHVVLLAVAPSSRTEVIHFMRGWSALLWWFGFIGIGIVFPMAIVMSKRAIKISIAWFFFGSLLIGGFLFRLVLVLSGQGAF